MYLYLKSRYEVDDHDVKGFSQIILESFSRTYFIADSLQPTHKFKTGEVRNAPDKTQSAQ